MKHMNLPVTARAAILQALLLEPMNPVDLREYLRDRGLVVSNGSLYPAVQALYDEGYLRIAARETGLTVNGGTAEACYALTVLGVKKAREIRETLLALLGTSQPSGRRVAPIASNAA